MASKATKKPAAKKTAAKKTTRKPAAKKVAAKKTTVKRVTARKAPVTKVASTPVAHRVTERRSNASDPFKVIVIILLVAILIANVMVLNQGGPEGTAISDAIEKNEILKVGGQENYDILTAIYKDPKFIEQQKASIEATLQRIKGQPSPSHTQPTAGPTSSKISQADVAKVLAGTYPMGKSNAEYVLLEYSDYLCPFCQRQHSQGVVAQLIENYGSDVNAVFKPNTRGNPSSMQIANATECAGDQGKFNEYVDEMFTLSPSVNNIATAAENIGLNMTTFNACTESSKHNAKITASMADGARLFGVRGTPGNVLLNTKTGEFVLIAGAYPYTEFENKLKELMSK